MEYHHLSLSGSEVTISNGEGWGEGGGEGESEGGGKR